jgi:hypothetical protein
LGALGVEPPRAGQRGLFGRGLRDVWLAQGAGRIEGVALDGSSSRGSSPPLVMSRMRSCTSVMLRRQAKTFKTWAYPRRARGSRCRCQPPGYRQLAGSALWSRSWCSCDRSSKIRRARCTWSSPGKRRS